MKSHECQAKQLLHACGVGIPGGHLAKTPFEAEAGARQPGGGVCAVKARIHAGGRGKAGGVKHHQASAPSHPPGRLSQRRTTR